jgi:hypothetical protein
MSKRASDVSGAVLSRMSSVDDSPTTIGATVTVSASSPSLGSLGGLGASRKARSQPEKSSSSPAGGGR